jgi:predicted DNA-binding WGR domain protein
MKVATQDFPELEEDEFVVEETKDLKFVDEKSNKFYHAELQVSNINDVVQIFTSFGGIGKTPNNDWRIFDDKVAAKKEFDRIIKSKLKKGYV